jgi:hypothetical protein
VPPPHASELVVLILIFILVLVLFLVLVLVSAALIPGTVLTIPAILGFAHVVELIIVHLKYLLFVISYRSSITKMHKIYA